MNQGALDVVRQETARVNAYILEISELKWTGRGEFSSDDDYVYYCGQESLRRNGRALRVNKGKKCSTWVQSQQRQNDLGSFPRQPFFFYVNNFSSLWNFLLIIYPLLQLFVCPETTFSLLNTISQFIFPFIQNLCTASYGQSTVMPPLGNTKMI